MIQGLKFYVKGEELCQLLSSQQNRFRELASNWRQSTLRKSVNEQMLQVSKANADAADRMSEQYEFAAKHVKLEETYEITPNEFIYLGFGMDSTSSKQLQDFTQMVTQKGN